MNCKADNSCGALAPVSVLTRSSMARAKLQSLRVHTTVFTLTGSAAGNRSSWLSGVKPILSTLWCACFQRKRAFQPVEVKSHFSPEFSLAGWFSLSA